MLPGNEKQHTLYTYAKRQKQRRMIRPMTLSLTWLNQLPLFLSNSARLFLLVPIVLIVLDFITGSLSAGVRGKFSWSAWPQIVSSNSDLQNYLYAFLAIMATWLIGNQNTSIVSYGALGQLFLFAPKIVLSIFSNLVEIFGTILHLSPSEMASETQTLETAAERVVTPILQQTNAQFEQLFPALHPVAQASQASTASQGQAPQPQLHLQPQAVAQSGPAFLWPNGSAMSLPASAPGTLSAPVQPLPSAVPAQQLASLNQQQKPPLSFPTNY
jgi:hypothetical protein